MSEYQLTSRYFQQPTWNHRGCPARIGADELGDVGELRVGYGVVEIFDRHGRMCASIR